MKFIYLPKPTKESFLFSKNKKSGRFYSRRHSKPKEVNRLVYMTVALYMLWVGLKLGFIIPALIQDPSATGAMKYVKTRDISLPSSSYTNMETAQSQYYVYVVIDEYGKTEIEGEPVPVIERTEYLKNLLYWQPHGIPVFIIDKDTPMKFVTDMIHKVREAGFSQIKLSTSREEHQEAIE